MLASSSAPAPLVGGTLGHPRGPPPHTPVYEVRANLSDLPKSIPMWMVQGPHNRITESRLGHSPKTPSFRHIQWSTARVLPLPSCALFGS